MKSVPTTKLKASLSHFLKQVRAGHELLVTDRGVPIAKLIGVPPDEALPEKLRDMAKRGLVRLPLRPLPENFWKLPRPKDPKGLTVRGLLREREEGR